MNWTQRLLQRNKMEAQLDKEVRFHIEQHTDELIARGHAPAEADAWLSSPSAAPNKSKKTAATRAVHAGWKISRKTCSTRFAPSCSAPDFP